jgi:hypothetical protein
MKDNLEIIVVNKNDNLFYGVNFCSQFNRIYLIVISCPINSNMCLSLLKRI